MVYLLHEIDYLVFGMVYLLHEMDYLVFGLVYLLHEMDYLVFGMVYPVFSSQKYNVLHLYSLDKLCSKQSLLHLCGKK